MAATRPLAVEADILVEVVAAYAESQDFSLLRLYDKETVFIYFVVNVADAVGIGTHLGLVDYRYCAGT